MLTTPIISQVEKDQIPLPQAESMEIIDATLHSGQVDK